MRKEEKGRTYVSWTPLFAIGREYGIRVVHQVFEATAKIESGQRIRVDGDVGAVYILEK